MHLTIELANYLVVDHLSRFDLPVATAFEDRPNVSQLRPYVALT